MLRQVALALFGRQFWVLSYACLAFGAIVPGDWTWAKPLIVVSLGGILYFTCLMLKLTDLGGEVSTRAGWFRLGLLTVMKLVVLPLIAWAIAVPLAPSPAWAVGVALVAMLPAGLSSPAFAQMLGGNAALGLLLVLATSLLTPLSVPVLLHLIGAGGAVRLSVIVGQSVFLALLLGVPFVAAQLTRAAIPAIIAAHPMRWRVGALTSLNVLIVLAVAVNRPAWAHIPWTAMVVPTGLTILSSFVFFGVAWASAFFQPKRDALAFACAAVYMNNGLGVAFATAFFPGQPEVILPAILMQIPMVGVTVLAGRVLGERSPPSSPASPPSSPASPPSEPAPA